MSTDNTFLHTLTPTKHNLVGRVDYLIDGNAWWTYHDWSQDQLNLHIQRDGQLVMLKISKSGDLFRWEYCREIAERVYARIHGTAETVDEAARNAFAVQPEALLRNGNVWYRVADDRWISAIDGDECTVRKFGNRAHWSRDYAAGDEVLKYAGISALTSHAGSLDAAMDACADAPAQFLLACREFIAEAERKASQAPAPADASIPQLRI